MRKTITISILFTVLLHSPLVMAGIVEGTCDQPYAQLPNGCSGFEDHTSVVRDDWKAFDFGPVCDEHDRCYYTLGTTAKECNRAFKDGLRQKCEEMDGTEYLLNYVPCRALAKAYTEVVEYFEDDAFSEAQTKQAEFEASCQNECDVEYGYMKIYTNYDAATNKDYRYVYFEKAPGLECVFRGMSVDLPLTSELENSTVNRVEIYGYGNRLGKMTNKAFVGVGSQKINDYRFQVDLQRVELSSPTSEPLETTLPEEIEGETLFFVDFLAETLDMYPYL